MIELLFQVIDKVEKIYKTVKYVIHERVRFNWAEAKKFSVGYKILTIPTRADAFDGTGIIGTDILFTLVDAKEFKDMSWLISLSDNSTAFKEHKREAIVSINEMIDSKKFAIALSNNHLIRADISAYKDHHKYVTILPLISLDIKKFSYYNAEHSMSDSAEAIKKKDIDNYMDTLSSRSDISKQQIVDKDAYIISYAIVEKESKEPLIIPFPIIIRSVKTPSNILILR